MSINAQMRSYQRAKRKSSASSSSSSQSSQPGARRAIRRRVPVYRRNRSLLPYADQPMRKLAKLKYVSYYGFTNTNGALGVVAFRANGMYDPEVAVGGHQPYGFDQLMAMYDHFTVVSSSINVQLVNHADPGQDAEPNVIGVSLVDTPGRVLSAYGVAGVNILEMPFVSKTLVDGPAVMQKDRSVNCHFNASKFFGKPLSTMIGDSEYRGSVAADPTEDATFEVFRIPFQADENNRQDVVITIIYTAWFTEPKWFATS